MANPGTDATKEPQEGSAASGDARAALSILDETARSPDPGVCPFFRREVDGALFAPLHGPDESNRCAAIGIPQPQSMRQQELICLQPAHADCPRYLRGATVLASAQPTRRQVTLPRATLAALLVLVLSAGISFGFVVQRGGIDFPLAAATSAPSQLAVVPTPTLEASAAATLAATPTPASTESAPPTPSPTAAPTPTPTATAEPTAKPSATPKPTSDRYALLKPCPDRKNCWIYTVRSGDNLYSIANYFGIKLSTIYDWNPRYADGARLRKGDQIRMPPPTR